MLDINRIRENPAAVKQAARDKRVEVDVDALLTSDDRRRELQMKIDEQRQQRNALAEKAKSGKPAPADIETGKQLKVEIAELEAELSDIVATQKEQLSKIPNLPTEDTPVGASEDDNVVISQWGEQPQFDFEPKTHDEIAIAKGWIDKERAAKVSGARFTYVIGDLVRLQFALMQFGMQVLQDEDQLAEVAKRAGLEVSTKPFIPILPPVLMRTEAYEATGRLKPNDVTYKIDQDDLWLVGSAEHSLCSMYIDEIMPREDLPLRYVGYSTAFRREAGTYGKDTAGIIRLHQFDKLEMESFTTAETSLEEHKFHIAIQEYLMQKLGLHYQVVLKCTADMGEPNARGVDIETWLPGEGAYRETHSADYMTDYQARGLNTRYQDESGRKTFVHTADATAFAGRTMVAIIEQNQTADGGVKIPAVLQPLLGQEVLQ